MKFEPGQIVRFTYYHKVVDENTGDKFKEIFILHNNWQGKVHGIDLKRLTAAERVVLQEIFDPQTKIDVMEGKSLGLSKQHLPLVQDIVRRMTPVEDIKNPVSFYSRFVKIFLRNKDAYRTYWPQQMSGVTIVKESSVSGKVMNPRPLFHKIESKAREQPKQQMQQKKGFARSVVDAMADFFGTKKKS